VSLADAPPSQIQLGDTPVRGEGIRYALQSAVRAAGMGVTEMVGIFTLAGAGTFDVRRDSGVVTTNVGFAVNEEWLRAPVTQIFAKQPGDVWVDVSAQAPGGVVPQSLVNEMMKCNERKLVEFRVVP
jgi:hypothetical protein